MYELLHVVPSLEEPLQTLHEASQGHRTYEAELAHVVVVTVSLLRLIHLLGLVLTAVVVSLDVLQLDVDCPLLAQLLAQPAWSSNLAAKQLEQ